MDRGPSGLNILFALFNDFSCNSANHVHALANGLVDLGHSCVVAVPTNKESYSVLNRPRYRGIEFSEAFGAASLFPNGRGPDVLHAWTPRECVRRFCSAFRESYDCRLFVHMEDNEWHLTRCALGNAWDRIALCREAELEDLISPHLSHPVKASEFLSQASGISVIIESLKELLPRGIPVVELWPSAEQDLFKPLPKTYKSRHFLGVAENNSVIVYTGNVHHANAEEVRTLYLAVAILNREGVPVTLLRTGKDFVPFLGNDDRWARAHSIELGYVPRASLPKLLAQADVLVQPGSSDPFNDYRFPSKLPEFLSAGRPVILPNANIASHMIHGRHGYILERANAVSIAGAVREILEDSSLRERLSAGALEFFNERLSWSASAAKLHDFYLNTAALQLPASTRDLNGRLSWIKAAAS
jgi:glycosyltransferase involved in cell wall biosynthesis